MSETANIVEQFPSDARRMEDLFRDGFVVVKNIASTDDVETIKRIASHLFDNMVGFEEGRYVNIVGADDQKNGPTLPQILRPRFSAKELKQTAFFASAHELARELIGPDAFLSFDHLIKKPAFDGAQTPWHQDEAFKDPAFEHTDLSVWLPLQPVDERNGCMRFIPGTNRGEVLPHVSPGGDDTVHGLECVAGFDPDDGVACPIDVGDCTVHLGRTVHGAAANVTAAPRYAYVLVFELPKQRRATPRSFPWRDRKKTSAMARKSSWTRTPLGVLTTILRRAME